MTLEGDDYLKKKTYKFAAAAIVTAMVMANVSYSGATSIQDEKDKQEQMDEDLQSLEDKIASLEQYKKDQEKYIVEMDKQLTQIADTIYSYEQKIEKKQEQIKKKKASIKKSKKEIKKQYEDMKLRIQYMYENSSNMYDGFLGGADSISDMLAKAEYVNEITEYDRKMLIKLRDDKAKLNKQLDKLESEEAALDSLLEDAKKQKSDMQLMVEAKKQVITKYKENISKKEQEALQLQQDIKAQKQIIAELEELERKRKEEEERRRQEALKRQQQADLPTYDGGMFKWPVPGYTYISSEFGNRSDPFTGQTAYHNGIDIPAPEGTPIIAAYDGEVVWAYLSASAGNWVGIDHGGGITTVYMHASKLLVTEGQKVKAGETIALVGTTGRSTGNHLHFTVRVNGVDQNPHNYFGG